MTVPSTAWSETSPAGSDSISLGDNRIREFKTQVREVVGVDHKFESSGQHVDMGKHKQVTLLEQADIGIGESGKTALGAQTISGKPELVYTDEDDNDIQLTKGGVAYPSQSTVLADWSKIMNLVYPIGSVVTLGVSTNPATLFGVGTWTAIAGKVIVGIDATQTEFDALNETGGAKTVTHSHTIPNNTQQTNVGWDGDGCGAKYYTTISHNHGGTTGNDVTSVLQPYIVKYVWERTA